MLLSSENEESDGNQTFVDTNAYKLQPSLSDRVIVARFIANSISCMTT